MATNISVRVSHNPYGMPGARSEVSFVWNGLLNRYQFDDRFQLADMLIQDSTEQLVVDEVMDSLDATEWEEMPVYPLGVVYVGEAVCDFGCDSVTSRTPDSARFSHETSVNPGYSSDVETSPFWEWFAATLKVGAVFAPWALLMIFCRVVWGWL